jgi:hypothetical protein
MSAAFRRAWSVRAVTMAVTATAMAGAAEAGLAGLSGR